MTKKSKYNYYAVAKGRKAPLICSSWDVAKKLVEGFSNAEHEGFKTLDEAEEWLKNRGHKRVEVLTDRGPRDGEPPVNGADEGRHSDSYAADSSGSNDEADKFPSQGHKSYETAKDDPGLIKAAWVIGILRRVAKAGEVGPVDIAEAMDALKVEE